MELKTSKHREMFGWELECIRRFPRCERACFQATEHLWVEVYMGSVVVHRKGTGDKLAFAQASIGPIWTGTLGWVTETGMSRHVFASLNEYLAEQGLLDSQKEERALEILSLLEKEFSDDAARRLPESSSPDELP